MKEKRLEIDTPKGPVSATLTGSGKTAPILVLAHGAGGGVDDPLLAGFAEGLSAEGISCLRFNFPYRELGKRAPDPEPVLRGAWEAAFALGAEMGSPVWVGGKSMGGRIASMAVADGLPAAGLVFLGYPLHPPGKPDRIRDEHLYRIAVPMLFLQGTSDSFATPATLRPVLDRIGPR